MLLRPIARRAGSRFVGCLAGLVAFAGCGAPGPVVKHFTERSAEAGLRAGNPSWGKGVSWVDFDGDGWEDLWLSNPLASEDPAEGAPRLLRNRHDGTFATVTLPPALAATRINWQGLWGDIDNDGDPDLLTVNGSLAERLRCALWRNDVSAGGSLTEITAAAGIGPQKDGYWGASFADFENDGDLDVVVTAPVESAVSMDGSGGPSLGLGPNGELIAVGHEYLYVNDGRGHFDEQGAARGLVPIAGNLRNPVWFDYDRDGDPDLFVAGMDDERLYRNDAGHFTDVTAATLGRLGIDPYTWVAAAADFDQDGWEDLYLGRWDAQDYLLRNRHDGTFERLGRDAGLDMLLFPITRENTMGLGVGDVNDDGYPDLVIGTGRPSEQELPIVYCNEGRPLRFHRCSEDFLPGNRGRHHGIALADFNHDGWTDVVFNNGGIPREGLLPRLFEQEHPTLFVGRGDGPAPTAAIHLVGTRSNRDAVGATIELHGAVAHFYTVHEGNAFQAQNGPWTTVFVGDDIVPVVVRWPSGRTSQASVARGQRLVLTEP